MNTYQLAQDVVVLLITLWLVSGLVGWVRSWFEPSEKDLLREIRDELKKRKR